MMGGFTAGAMAGASTSKLQDIIEATSVTVLDPSLLIKEVAKQILEVEVDEIC